ncbi:DUF1330 domain-containing protein [Altererythrobacter salegens]|uniref:DUF1330 domain-containing protein n=1 Tax=Croceibacterium salegens TaxID=1737568 RepID=A0A6I4SV76_9SPHN|nr:DUF1330 domain-containing protein [Croceibacterium salegens]MXO59763.1 DUF1330 domain-containing protein [Croceibacterium salegens]
MAGYVIAQYRVTNPEGMQEYAGKVLPTLQAHGAEVVVVDHGATVLEGDTPPTTIVLKFPSVEAASAWYNSPEYSAIKHLRIDNSDMARMVVAKGFSPPV